MQPIRSAHPRIAAALVVTGAFLARADEIGRKVIENAIVLAILLIAATLFLYARSADARDTLEIVTDGHVIRFDGVLVSRMEDGESGSIEFGAEESRTTPLKPVTRVEPPYVGDYDVTVIPHDGGVDGFQAEHCRRGRSAFHHYNGVTYIRISCP